MPLAVSAVVLLLILAGVAHADNWPAWRGPRGDGICAEQRIPLKWSRTENVRWKVALPYKGNSSPIVWNDHVFLTCALDAKGRKRAVLALARNDGRLLW